MGKNIPPELGNPRAEKILVEKELKSNIESSQSQEIISAELNLELGEVDVLLGEIQIKVDDYIEGKNLSKKEAGRIKRKIIVPVQKKRDRNKNKKNKESGLVGLKELKSEIEKALGMGVEAYLEYLENPGFIEEVSAQGAGESKQVESKSNDAKSESVIIDEGGLELDLNNDEVIQSETNGAEFQINEEISEKERIRKDIEEFIVDMEILLIEFEKKKDEFKNNFSETGRVEENMNTTSRAYRERMEKFKQLKDEDLNQEKLVEINQLHNRLCKLLEIDWNEYYKEKIRSREESNELKKDKNGILVDENMSVENKNSKDGLDNDGLAKVTGTVLEDLKDHEYEGQHSPVIEKVNRADKREFLRGLISKYGDVGTVYFKYDEKGDYLGRITLAEYDLSGPDFFVVLNVKNRGKKRKEEKIKLDELGEYLREYINEDWLNIKKDIELDGKITSDEKKELESFTKERIQETEEVLKNLKEEYFKLEKPGQSKEEKEKTERRMQVYELSLVKIKDIVNKDPKAFETQSIFNLVEELYIKIKTLEDNIKDGLGNENREMEELMSGFSEAEKKVFEKMLVASGDLKNQMKERLDWGKLSGKRIEQMTEDQVILFLMSNFEKKGIFVDREEVVAEFIIKKTKK